MSAFREHDVALDEFTEELSTFTNADAQSLVFEAGGKQITINQTLGVTSHCGAIVWDAGAAERLSLTRHKFTASNRRSFSRHTAAYAAHSHASYICLRRLTPAAAVVMVRYVEKQYGRKLKGKRVVELGGGCGLGGIAIAHSCSAHVTITDTPEVCVNILSNVRANAQLQRLTDAPSAASDIETDEMFRASYGSIRVLPLSWGDEPPACLHHTANLILASDCVFKESLVMPFLLCVKRLLAPRGTAIVANEFRSASVHATFLQVAEDMFSVFLVPTSMIPAKFRHPMIQLYALTALPPAPDSSLPADCVDGEV